MNMVLIDCIMGVVLWLVLHFKIYVVDRTVFGLSKNTSSQDL